MTKVWAVTKYMLLAFVLISIGFALGRRSGQSGRDFHQGQGGGRTVVDVYYFHATFRCVTCNTIEKMTRQLLESKFKKELASRAMAFREVNFQDNEELSKRFGVAAGCVVVAAVRNGEVLEFRRLDDVWTLMRTPSVFDKYISDAIEAVRRKL